MKYIKLYEDLEFDPNNFRKLRKDIKDMTIELVDNGFKVQPFEADNDNGFDNYDYYVKIYTDRWGYKIKDIEDYIEMIKEYIDNYYTYSKLKVEYLRNGYLIGTGVKSPIKPDDNITQVEIEISDIKKK